MGDGYGVVARRGTGRSLGTSVESIDGATFTVILGALALSGAAGLNPWLPVLLTGGLERSGWVHLAPSWSWVGDSWVLVLSAALFAAQCAGAGRRLSGAGLGPLRLGPGVLRLGDLALAAGAGALLFEAAAGEHVALLVSVLLGGGTSAVLHGARAAARPVDAPALSLLEDVAAALIVVVAFSLPAVGGVVVVALLGGALGAARLASP